MNRNLENEELKRDERIRKKEQKKRLRKQKERRKKILNTFCWVVAFLIICAIFAWWFYIHRDMTEANTHEITVKVDKMIVDWEDNYLPDDPYPYVDIISGDITYHAHPPLRIKEFNECSFEEITQEDQVILTVKNSDNLYFVGVRSESKVYYDTEEHYNRFARLQRVGVVIAFCVTGFGYFWFFMLFNLPETCRKIGLFLGPPRRKKKPK